MEFLGEEAHGALTAQKFRYETSLAPNFTSTAAMLYVRSKLESTPRWCRRSVDPFCVFCENNSHWAQDCKAVIDVKEHIEKLRAANRFFPVLTTVSICTHVAKGTGCSARSERGDIISLFV
jgi:hypothetical protein